MHIYVCGQGLEKNHETSTTLNHLAKQRQENMALSVSATATVFISFLLLLVPTSFCSDDNVNFKTVVPQSDADLLEFPLNLEYLEAELFLWASLGRGLDSVAPDLTMGGPPPVGARKATLDPFTNDVILQFAYQEVGHLRFRYSILI